MALDAAAKGLKPFSHALKSLGHGMLGFEATERQEAGMFLHVVAARLRGAPLGADAFPAEAVRAYQRLQDEYFAPVIRIVNSAHPDDVPRLLRTLGPIAARFFAELVDFGRSMEESGEVPDRFPSIDGFSEVADSMGLDLEPTMGLEFGDAVRFSGADVERALAIAAATLEPAAEPPPGLDLEQFSEFLTGLCIWVFALGLTTAMIDQGRFARRELAEVISAILSEGGAMAYRGAGSMWPDDAASEGPSENPTPLKPTPEAAALEEDANDAFLELQDRQD